MWIEHVRTHPTVPVCKLIHYLFVHSFFLPKIVALTVVVVFVVMVLVLPVIPLGCITVLPTIAIITTTTTVIVVKIFYVTPQTKTYSRPFYVCLLLPRRVNVCNHLPQLTTPSWKRPSP